MDIKYLLELRDNPAVYPKRNNLFKVLSRYWNKKNSKRKGEVFLSGTDIFNTLKTKRNIIGMALPIALLMICIPKSLGWVTAINFKLPSSSSL